MVGEQFVTLEDTKNFFGLNDTEDYDNQLSFLISFYSGLVAEAIGANIDSPTMKMKFAVFSGVGCHLERVEPELAAFQVRFEVGKTKEWYETRNQDIDTWCDYYELIMDEILAESSGRFPSGSVKRRGVTDEFNQLSGT